MLNWIEKEKDEYFTNEAALARFRLTALGYILMSAIADSHHKLLHFQTSMARKRASSSSVL